MLTAQGHRHCCTPSAFRLPLKQHPTGQPSHPLLDGWSVRGCLEWLSRSRRLGRVTEALAVPHGWRTAEQAAVKLTLIVGVALGRSADSLISARSVIVGFLNLF